jgi:eukaryotic-like serine/threonine-protein kinase
MTRARPRPPPSAASEPDRAYPTEPLPPFTSAEDPLRGTPYRFVRALDARGEMGELVEAEHTALRRHVIVKLLGAKVADSADFADRMRLEAQALAAISHPHVVTVLDVGKTPAGRIFLVMEKLVGRTLGDELAARGFLPVGEAVALVRQMLDGLDAVHGAGLVHREVKPANLFLCDEARGRRVLKIIDFGIAKIVRRHADRGGPLPLAQPTAPLAIVGTPRWMAPEQILLEPVGAWTDLYSAGAVLYALITGRDPFGHYRDPSSLLQAHVDEKPPLPSIGAPQVIPEAIERAIMKALEKRPADRWASAAELGEALDRALGAAPSTTEARSATLSASGRPVTDTPHTAGGGTAIQSPLRTDAPTAPRALARTVSHPSGSRPLRRTPWAGVPSAAVIVVGTLVGVAHHTRRPAPAPEHASASSTSPPAPLAPHAAAPAQPPLATPSAMAEAGATATFIPAGSASALPARPPALKRIPRRVQEPAKTQAVPADASVVRLPAPLPPPPAASAAAHRMFGVEP